MLRIRHSAAALCYGFAWLSMIALIAMVAVAEAIQGEVAVNADSDDADTFALLNMVRRNSR